MKIIFLIESIRAIFSENFNAESTFAHKSVILNVSKYFFFTVEEVIPAGCG